ncbi:cytochrome c oxidase assembly protein [Micromonospora deserti]|uniref:Cytochrome c oxidase assembly protein n=1 Tax=Micromonospora deserti TaxID=2070366 RepID=A0A2W2E9G5_9ACTN|nr:cytochrome c oxidase assembly protein [Micromonospora deserti]PZG01544.1 cytochrome c oxidase assembly protein [Micromonospora deserti]
MTGLAGAGADPLPLTLVALLAAGYLLAVTRDRRGWRRGRSVSWLAGCAVLALAFGPLAGGSADPRVHVAQHLLLGMVAPLGLALGAPVTLLLRVAPPPVRRAVTRVLRARPLHLLAHPATAALLATGGLAVVLLTPLYAAAERNPWLHHGLHLHYLAAGYVFAWAVAGPDPAPRRAGPAMRAGVLLGAAAGHAVLAKYLYAHAATLPPGLADRDVAALRSAARLMWYGGDVAELLLAAAFFAAWYGRRGRRVQRAACGLPAVSRTVKPSAPQCRVTWLHDW